MSGPTPSSSSAGQSPSSYFDQVSGKWAYEDPLTGNTLEWDTIRNAWVPVVEDDLIKAQQAAYSVQGVDEEAPVAGQVARDSKKRKQEDEETQEPDGSGGAKHSKKGKQKQNTNNKPPPNRQTAIWVSHLPPSTTQQQLKQVFSKAGLILEDANGDPRIKLYYDDQDNFKGDALIVYLQEQSVELAVTLFDQTELELGSGEGNISVKKAEWEKKKGGEGSNGVSGEQATREAPSRQSEQDKQKAKKRAEKLKEKLSGWSSDEDNAGEAAVKAKNGGKIVVLKGMFTLAELEEDPTLLLDLKEEVREECEKLGEVTNVTLYDLEDDGVITIRFKTELGAQACIAKNHGRYFAGRNISAALVDGKEKFRKTGQRVSLSGTGLAGDDTLGVEEEEEQRRDKYAEWLEAQGA